MSDLRKDDGGPAFPKPLDPYPNMQDARSGTEGMSLRDYFAAQALPTCISLSQGRDGDWDEHSAAVAAYAVADAMIAARSA